MIPGRPKKPITFSKDEREQLSAMKNSRSLPSDLVRRARIILLAGWYSKLCHCRKSKAIAAFGLIILY